MDHLITLVDPVTHDETAGVQNDGTEDDIATLPTDVDDILSGLGLDSSTAIGFASDIVLDIDSSVTGLRFTDAAGEDLNGALSVNFKTTAGDPIKLYTAGDGDVLLGKLGDTDTVVFAVVMSAPDADGNVTFTMIQWDSLYHGDTTDHDDTITLDDFVSVTAASDLEFSGFKAPPGNNEWLYFGTEAADTQIIVTAGVPGAETVNTSQTGLAIANQAINPGETIRISFVTGASGDTKDIDALSFDTQVLTNSAGFKVSQVNPTNSTVDLQIALSDAPSGQVTGGTPVGITSFVIYDENGVEVLDLGDITVDVGTGTIANLPGYYTVRFTGADDFDTFTVLNSLSTDKATFDISSVIFGSDEAETQSVGDYVEVEDDGPTATVAADGTEPGAAYLFDGNQANGNFEGNNGTGAPTDDADRDGSPTSVTVAFAGAFSVSTAFGQDGAGSASTAYSLVLAASGQVQFLDGNGATVNATSGGTAVDWSEVTAGSVYAGVLTGTTTEVFRLSVDADGKVTFSQSAPLDHTRDDTTGPYSTDILTLADGQISVKATATATDYEGDSASDDASVDLGGNFAVGDDGPKASAAADGTEPGTAYLFDGNQANGNFEGNNGTGAPTDDADRDGSPTSVTSDFSVAFSTSALLGADGGSVSGSTAYSLVLAASGQVQFLDGNGATVNATSGGTAVDWSTVTAGSVYAGVLTGTTTEVFRLSVDADGKVTFSQSAPLDHTRDDTAGPYSTDILTLADGQISVKVTATATDSEGDTATADASVDLGGNFAVGDDGPKVTVAADGTEPGAATLYDGNLTGGNFPVGSGATSVEVDFSVAFSTTPAAGADGGSGSTTTDYSLVLAASGQVQFKDNADATVLATSGGTKILWSEVTAGSVYAGVLEGTSTEVFRLAIDGDGKVTFSQFGPLDHTREDDAPDYTTDMLTLADGQISVKASATVTDSEGDSATDDATVDLGGNFAIGDDGPVDLTPAAITVENGGGNSASAALGYFGNVGADVLGSVLFSGTNGSQLQGIIKDGSNETPEPLESGGSPIYLFGFGTDTLIASTDSTFDPTGFDSGNPAASVVFYMTLDPDNGTEANDTYSITMLRSVDNLVEVDFGDFTAAPSSGNPLTLIVNNVGGSGVDALFSGFLDGPSSTEQTTVNVSGAGVGVGTGQDFDYDMNTGIADRIKIEFIEDNGNGSLDEGEERTVNNFTFIMNQNNSPADDGNALVRVYDEDGIEVQITGVEINDTLLTIDGSSTVPSNDGTFVSATAAGLGIILDGLGGGTAGSTADNDSVTIITDTGYHRIDITGIGEDANKDTFDILLGSVSVPLPYNVEFTTQAYLMDEDDDRSSNADLDVVLDYDGVIA